MFESLATQIVSFTPVPDAGAKNPMFMNQRCYGLHFDQTLNDGDSLFLSGVLILENFYREFEEYKRTHPAEKNSFFKDYFTDLSGSKKLQSALEKKIPAKQIWESWRGPVDAFKNIRKKYLMYPE
jgi:uncharacterized protein YbbC (DUF1343 family)